MDGPIYTCGQDGLRCEDPTCLDPDRLAEFPDCGGNLLRLGDGACDAYNNNEECGYDGGDCCLCTCIKNGECVFRGIRGFGCVDPSAEEGLYQCQPPPPHSAPCAVEIQRTWVVEDSTQARALAQAVNCSGGTFDVLWKGFVTVERTIYVASGTVLTITGVGEPSTAVIHGGLQTQILTAINASLHVINVSFSLGSSVFGGAIAASASNMTFTRTSFVGNMASGMGGAIYMENHSTAWFDMETSLLRNSAVGFGGALYACGNSSVTFTVEEAHILHNAAGESGGAIAIDQSHIWWSGNTFYSNNTSGYSGGAVDVANGCTARWFGSNLFSENTATLGGALAVYLKSDVSWSGGMVLEYNQAIVMGGAIYVQGADISWDGSTIFTSNIALTAGGALSAVLGADVSWSGDTVFKDNRATSAGGAIYVESAEVSWSGVSSYVINSAEEGGAVYAAFGSFVRWNTSNTIFVLNMATSLSGGAVSSKDSNMSWTGNTTFEYNIASSSGGAVSVNGANVSWSGDTAFKDNTATLGGGAIYIESAEVSWSGVSSFFNNSAEGGGAVYAAFGSFVRWDASNTIFVLNMATSWSGGAVSISDSTMSWNGSTTFESNIANDSGGAVAVFRADVSWSGDTSFKDNQATALGGAIFVLSAEVSCSGVLSFFNNSAEAGGAIYVMFGSFVRWDASNTTFILNMATSSSGGAATINNSTILWTGNTTFESNQANDSGGAVAVFRADVSWSGDTSFKDNQATALGGAIFVLSAEVSCSGVLSFFNNSAEAGGAIYVMFGSFVRWDASNTTFILNMATSSSGGAATINNSTILWTGNTTFESNQANTVGGAIFAYDVAMSMRGDTIFECNRAAHGGAAYLIGSRVTWDGNTEFVSNTASGFNISGGGALVAARVNVSWGGVTLFYNNSAISGGAVSIRNSSDVEWSGKTLFLNNSAALVGGGVIAWEGTNVNWRGDTMFVSNNAILGGAVYINKDVRARWTGQTKFSSNEAGEQGGAVASAASVASTDDDLISFLLIEGVIEFVDNVSGRDGGAISLVGGVLVEIEPTAKVSFRRNYARVSGGAIFMSGANVGPIFRGVSFVSNSAQFGGGVHATSSGNAKIDLNGKETFNPTVFDRCIFVDNTAIATGGAIQSAAGQDYIISTSFIGNTARAGGALFLAGTTNFFNCSFFDNVAEEGNGPAISNIGYVESMKNSTFVGNAYNCAAGTFRAFDSVRSAFVYY